MKERPDAATRTDPQAADPRAPKLRGRTLTLLALAVLIPAGSGLALSSEHSGGSGSRVTADLVWDGSTLAPTP